uniref:Uncharacterized protein n=1 Tax=Panagrolaimus sp. PS1159 TaxID=55785 RepID=A0AC35GNL9_9BILA
MAVYFLLFIFSIIFYYCFRYFRETLILPNLNKRVVFITGCDSGFGRLLAIKCVKNGIQTFAGCLTSEGAENLENEVADSELLKTVELDVTSEDSVKNAVKFVKENLKSNKKLWAIVNNAGVLLYEGPSEWIGVESYKKTAEVNTYGVIRVCNAFLPLLRESKGRIITITSCAGRIGFPLLPSYAVSKFATEAYMDCLRRDVYDFGITCHILEPGRFKTDIVRAENRYPKSKQAWNSLPQEIKDIYGNDYLEKVDKTFYEILEEKSTSRLDFVVDAYFHAISAVNPRLRYIIGYDANFLIIPLSFVPTAIQDWILRHLARIPIPASVQRSIKKEE